MEIVNKVNSKLTKTTDNKFITKNNTQVAHINSDGELVMDKLTDLSEFKLNGPAKLEDNLDDVDYYKVGSSTKNTDDVLIFEHDGAIKICAGGSNCFVQNTLVHTENGLKAIETIKENDVVLSYNEETQKTSMQKVTQLFKKTAYALNRIIVGRDTLWATPEHKFYIAAKGWVQAAGLTAGMLMQSQVGTAAINSNVAIDTVAEVYNFTVDINHTYYVGKENLLTHNVCAEVAELIKSGKLNPKYADDFEKQFGNTPLLKKFVDGDLDVRAWEAILKKTPPPVYHPNVKATYIKLIENGGNAILQQDGTIKLFSKNREFAALFNGSILPSIGPIGYKNINYWNDFLHGPLSSPQPIPFGDKMNGYQVYKKGNDFIFKRVPDESAYTAAEKSLLNDHPNAHTTDKHGHDVTDEACIQRANSGVAPDGSVMSNPPPYSSKFETPEQLKLALENTKPGTTAFDAVPVSSNGVKIVEHSLPVGSYYGKGVPRNSNTFIKANKVVAKYQEITPNNWKLITMYPEF